MDRCREILAQNNVTRRFQMYKLFNINDTDNSYNLGREEIRTLFRNNLKTELTDDELNAIMSGVDADGDGSISFTEWVAVLFPEK